jgi:lipopolysaccharide biosynthesis glycosyltransferase
MFHLAIAFDNNYLVPFYALACSIFENNKKTAFHFHCIIRNIEEKEKQNIIEYLKENSSRISFYEVDEKVIKNFVTLSHWNTSVYYKMFFPLLIDSSVKKILYLDTDMLVINSLNELYQTDLEGFPLAAVYDNYVKIQPDLGIIEEGKYFNSGMMLIDVKKWNIEQISQKAINFLQIYPEQIKFVDQCALNAVLKDNWLRVEEKFNLIYSYIPQDLSNLQLQEFIKDKVVIHFTLQRPWNFLCKNRLRVLYQYYLKKSPKKSENSIVDFHFNKLMSFLKIRLSEFYLDSPMLQKTWRKIK